MAGCVSHPLGVALPSIRVALEPIGRKASDAFTRLPVNVQNGNAGLGHRQIVELSENSGECVLEHLRDIMCPDIRACLRRYDTSQATDHQMDHRHTDHGFTGLG
jgi:hypothetical protein